MIEVLMEKKCSAEWVAEWMGDIVVPGILLYDIL